VKAIRYQLINSAVFLTNIMFVLRANFFDVSRILTTSRPCILNLSPPNYKLIAIEPPGIQPTRAESVDVVQRVWHVIYPPIL